MAALERIWQSYDIRHLPRTDFSGILNMYFIKVFLVKISAPLQVTEGQTC